MVLRGAFRRCHRLSLLPGCHEPAAQLVDNTAEYSSAYWGHQFGKLVLASLADSDCSHHLHHGSGIMCVPSCGKYIGRDYLACYLFISKLAVCVTGTTEQPDKYSDLLPLFWLVRARTFYST